MEIAYHPQFIRQYKKYSSDLRDEIKKTIDLLKKDINHKSLKTHKLHGGLKKYFACSVNYNYRLIFEVNKKEVYILDSGVHDEVYR